MKICPKCGSKNLNYKPQAFQVKTNPNPDYQCEDCEFTGQFPEIN